MRAPGVVGIALLALLAIAPLVAAAAEPLPSILHVHTTLSTGDLTLRGLLAEAEREGIGAVLLAENYLLRIEYGLPPFRALTRVAYEEASVLERRDVYAREVAEARRRFPRMVLIPGVEILPHYRWTGSPLAMAMTLHDTQKNILVFGVDPLDLHALPVVGNRHVREWTLQSAIDAVPALLVIPGIALLLRPRVRRRRVGSAIVVGRTRPWLRGGLLLGLGIAALVRGWPFTVDRYPPWEDFGLDPHQALIDDVDRRGGVTMWSFPEAPDAGERQVGPVQVSWRTDPYPEDLYRTGHYTAFGAVYEQPTKLARPGDGWDRLLRQYIAGERSRPTWGVGEVGFHGTSRAGKRLTPVRTIFFVNERSEAAVLDAFKRGRMYALRRSGDVTLVLSEFALASATGSAGMGDTLSAPSGTPVEVRATVADATGAASAVRVTLVKNGEVAGTWSGTTPFTIQHRDTADGRRAYYRLDARVSAGDYLVGNPVFVAP